MDKRRILIQLDTDPQPSVFDRVVGIDAGTEELFSYGGVTPEQTQSIVHGAIFTRGPKDLNNTAIFIGGSDVSAGEQLLEHVRRHMLPSFRLQVSVMLDSNGANTTAAAAVRAAARHLDLSNTDALVLGGTGPVGQRVSHLLARLGTDVRVGSRQQEKAAQVCTKIKAKVADAKLRPVGTGSVSAVQSACDGCALVISAGAAGVQLLPKALRPKSVRVAIDLNAVPPLGIEGIELTDKGSQRDDILCYGAVGIGDTKMKIHKEAICKLFETNGQILDVDEIYQIAQGLV